MELALIVIVLGRDVVAHTGIIYGFQFMSQWLHFHSSLWLPAYGFGKQLRMAKILEPCTHMGDLEETPCSWLWISTAPAIAAIWELNQQMDDLPFFLSFSWKLD